MNFCFIVLSNKIKIQTDLVLVFLAVTHTCAIMGPLWYPCFGFLVTFPHRNLPSNSRLCKRLLEHVEQQHKCRWLEFIIHHVQHIILDGNNLFVVNTNASLNCFFLLLEGLHLDKFKLNNSWNATDMMYYTVSQFSNILLKSLQI